MGAVELTLSGKSVSKYSSLLYGLECIKESKPNYFV